MGRSLDLGKVMVTLADGVWNAMTSYEILTAVYHNGDGYISRRDNIGVEPGSDDSVWYRIVKQGQIPNITFDTEGNMYADDILVTTVFADVIRRSQEAVENVERWKEVGDTMAEEESKRKNSEDERDAAENARARNEQNRSVAEDARARSESTREANERERVLAESEREERFEEAMRQAASTMRKGDRGYSAYEVAVLEEGFEGSKEEWLASLIGSQGKSAYQVAVDNGFEGTISEWLVSLIGPKGDTGTTPNISVGTVSTGAPGSPVVVTITGTAEAPMLNLTIPQGLKGDQGLQGNTGSSVDYPFELVNNLTTDDATKALSAAQGVVLEGEISQLSQGVGDLSEFVTEGWQPVAVVATTDYYFKFDTLAEYAQSIAEYVILSVQPGEKYKIDGWNYSSSAPLAFVRKAGATSPKARAIYQSSAGHMSGEYTIPDGYDTLVINGRTANYPVTVQKWAVEQKTLAELVAGAASKDEIEESKMMHVAVIENSDYVAGSSTVKGQTIVIGQRFNNSFDAVWRIGNKNDTINRFFDLRAIYLAPRNADGPTPLTELVDLTYLLGHETDYILPIRVKAVNNINGDFTGDENYFTGGFHGYGNNTSGNYSQTMREVSKKILLDGKELQPGDSLYGNRLVIEVINNVQASNTEKADGSGREVIQQLIRVIVEGKSEAKVEVEWTALEDVDVNTLHCFGQYFDFTNVRFVGSSTRRGVYTKGATVYPSDEKTNLIRCYDNTYAFEVGMDNGYGLGDGQCREGVRNAFMTNASKGYFNVLRDDGTPIRLESGDMVAYRGRFRLSPVL